MFASDPLILKFAKAPCEKEVGAARRTRAGRVIPGVNIDAYIGRIAVCAEAIAIGRAITESGDHGIETIVAVRHPKHDGPGNIPVVSPCGLCPELIHDYDAKARVIVPDNGRTPKVVTIGELLPNKYKRGNE